MDYKYKEHHIKLSCICPPQDSLQNLNQKAFRFVHEDISHNNNFKPPLVIEPNRKIEELPCEVICKGYALSFYNDANTAEKKLIRLISHKPLIKEAIGDCIASGDIIETDGKAEFPHHGHFEFHEYSSTDFKTKFTVLKKVNYEI